MVAMDKLQEIVIWASLDHGIAVGLLHNPEFSRGQEEKANDDKNPVCCGVEDR